VAEFGATNAGTIDGDGSRFFYYPLCGPNEELPMNSPLRVAVADDEPEMLAYLQETLSLLGHQIVAAATNGRQVLQQCQSVHPDLLITDIKMPDMDGLQVSRELTRERPLPVILVSAYHDHELIERALKDHVLAYLVKPIKQADLETAISLAVRRFKEFQALHKQADDLKQALEDRKLIERAKGILMKRGRLDEPEAFRRLQKLSSDKNQKMVEISRMIITAEEAMAGE
jgi:response regulator NasT